MPSPKLFFAHHQLPASQTRDSALTSFSKAEARAVEEAPCWAGAKAAAPATRAERAASLNMVV